MILGLDFFSCRAVEKRRKQPQERNIRFLGERALFWRIFGGMLIRREPRSLSFYTFTYICYLELACASRQFTQSSLLQLDAILGGDFLYPVPTSFPPSVHSIVNQSPSDESENF
jgi:hypothetical protein